MPGFFAVAVMVMSLFSSFFQLVEHVFSLVGKIAGRTRNSFTGLGTFVRSKKNSQSCSNCCS